MAKRRDRGELPACLCGDELMKWLLEYSRLLREDFGAAAREGAESFQGSLNKMRDAFELLAVEAGDTGAFGKINEKLRKFADNLRGESARASMRELASQLNLVAGVAGMVAKMLWASRDAIQGIVVAVGLYKGANFVKHIGTEVAALVAKAQAMKVVESLDIRQRATIQAAIGARKAMTRANLEAALAEQQLVLAHIADEIRAGKTTAEFQKNTIAKHENTVATLQNALASDKWAKGVVGSMRAVAASVGLLGGITIALGLLSWAWTSYNSRQEKHRIEAEEAAKKDRDAAVAIADLNIELFKQRQILEDTTKSAAEHTEARLAMRRAINETEKALDLSDKKQTHYIENEKKKRALLDETTAALKRAAKAQVEENEKIVDGLKEKIRLAKHLGKTVDMSFHTIYDETLNAWRSQTNAEKKMYKALYSEIHNANTEWHISTTGRAAEGIKRFNKELKEAENTLANIQLRYEAIGMVEPGLPSMADIMLQWEKFLHPERFQPTEEDYELIRLKHKIERKKDELALDEKRRHGEKLMDEATAKRVADAKKELALDEARLKVLTAEKTRRDMIAADAHKKGEADLLVEGAKADAARQRELAEADWTNSVADNARARIDARHKEAEEFALAEQKIADERKKREDALQAFIESGRKGTLDFTIAKIRKETEDAIAKLKAAAEDIVGPLTPEMAKSLAAAKASLDADVAAARAAGSAREATSFEDATKSRLSALKQELTTLTHIKGGLSALDYEDVFKRMAAAAAGNEDEVKALTAAYIQLRAELHLDGTVYEGLTYGIREWAAESANHFKNFAEAAREAGNAIQSGLSGAMEKALESGKQGREKWKEIGAGLKSSAIKILTELAAKELIAVAVQTKGTVAKKNDAVAADMQAAANEALAKSVETVAGANVTGATAQLGMNEAMKAGTVATLELAAAQMYLAQSWFTGGALKAGAEVQTMMGVMEEVKIAGVALTRFARGGLIDMPTLALLGEGGQKEFVAPEKDFMAWAREVFETHPGFRTIRESGFGPDMYDRANANIARYKEHLHNYELESAAMVRAAYEGGMQPVTNNYYTSNYTLHTKREMADFVSGLMDYRDRRT